MHHRIHLRTDPDGTHHLNAKTFDQVSGDDDLSNQPHTQPTVLRLDAHCVAVISQPKEHVELVSKQILYTAIARAKRESHRPADCDHLNRPF